MEEILLSLTRWPVKLSELLSGRRHKMNVVERAKVPQMCLSYIPLFALVFVVKAQLKGVKCPILREEHVGVKNVA